MLQAVPCQNLEPPLLNTQFVGKLEGGQHCPYSFKDDLFCLSILVEIY